MSKNKILLQKPKLTPTLLTIIFLLITLMQVTTDLYIPSLPGITAAFASTAEKIQLTLSVYMLGFSASHLFYGPISDRIGRKTPILVGVGISALGSLVCFVAPSATILILGRFIQGIGIGCCNSVGRSLARDLLSDRMLAKIGSHIGMASVIILALSPTVGGYVQQYLGWRANFLFLLIFGLAIWVLTYYLLPETNRHCNPDATKMAVMASNYSILLRSKTFMGYTLCSCFAGAGLIAYLTVAPFLLQERLGLSPVEYGWLAFIIAAAIFISGFINSKLVLKKGISTMVLWGAIIMLVGGVMMMAVAWYERLSVSTFMIPIFVFSLGAGFTFINAFAGAFDPFPKMAGTTGALFGCLQDLSSALVSAMMAVLAVNNQNLLAVMLILLSIFSLFAWKFISVRSASEKRAFTSH